MEYIERAWIAN